MADKRPVTESDRFRRTPAGSRFDGQKGPNGRALCRQCGTECDSKRKTFCGKVCVDAWKVERWPSEQRKHVLERDKGVCALCGLDCSALEKELRALCERNYRDPKDLTAFRARVAELSLPNNRAGDSGVWGWVNSLWDMDHIVPVVEGGGSCTLENLRTLCWKCHQGETAKLAKRRAERRRAAKGAQR